MHESFSTYELQKQQNCKLNHISGQKTGIHESGCMKVRDESDGQARQMVDMDSVSSVTEGGLNSRKKKPGYRASLPPRPALA